MLAVDIETTMPSKDNPIPTPVCIQVYDGETVSMSTDVMTVLDYLVSIENEEVIVFHYGAFDLGTYIKHRPQMLGVVMERINKDLIMDTYIFEKLFFLSTHGEVKLGNFGLDKLVKRYLNVDISSSKKDNSSWRMKYGQLLGKELKEYPPEAIEYAAKDVVYTYNIALKQLETSKLKGPGSVNTYKLQLSSSIILQLISYEGIKIDINAVNKLKNKIEDESVPHRTFIVDRGFGEIDEKSGKFKKESKKFREYLVDHFEPYVTRTPLTKKGGGNSVEINKDALLKYPSDEIVRAFLEYGTNEKLLTTYLPQLESSFPQGIIYPSYDVLKETGRISSFKSSNLPSTNIQQPPRKPGVRECFIPRQGKKLISIDYSTLELCGAAQRTYDLFGHSKMREAINNGYDLHSLLAAKVMKCDYTDFIKLYSKKDENAVFYRQVLKQINLGYPGGIGPLRMAEISRKSGVDISLELARELKELFFDSYPYLKKYLKEYIPSRMQFNETYAYETNGRFRNNCTFCQMANGDLMQSLAADGFKIAMIALYLYKPGIIRVPFHDEFLFEVDELQVDKMLPELSKIMIGSMNYVMPDILISVEATVFKSCWSKDSSHFEKTVKFSTKNFENTVNLGV